MTDTRTPAHRLAQALLDRGVGHPALWSPKLERLYSEAIEAAALVAVCPECRGELQLHEDRFPGDEGQHMVCEDCGWSYKPLVASGPHEGRDAL